MPATCDDYLGRAKGYCPEEPVRPTRFCSKHIAEREECLPGSTTYLDYFKEI